MGKKWQRERLEPPPCGGGSTAATLPRGWRSLYFFMDLNYSIFFYNN